MELAIGKIIALILGLITLILIVSFALNQIGELNLKCIGGENREECNQVFVPFLALTPNMVRKTEIFKRLVSNLLSGDIYVK